MKKIILRAVGTILAIIVMVGAFFTISAGNEEWFIEYDETQNISWYYELVNGEAVNVRTTGGNAQHLTKLVVPETLGGYPVTSLRGLPEQTWGWKTLEQGTGNILGESGRATTMGLPVFDNYTIKEVVLPEGLKELKRHSLAYIRNLEKINIPSTVEVIGYKALAGNVSLKEIKFEHPNNEFIYMDEYAFCDSQVERLYIDNIDTWNHDLMGSFKKVEFGPNVKHIKGQIYCDEDADIHIPSTVESFANNVFMHATDIWVDNEEENVQVANTKSSGYAWVHFNNKEKVITHLPEGIKAINTATNEEFDTIKVPTGSDFSFKLVQTEGYNYDKYTIYIEGYTKTCEKTLKKLDLRFDQEYTIENITRDKTIYLETREDKIDLNLRQYIWGIDDDDLVHSRAPVVEIQQDRTVVYKHSKLPLYPKKDNKVRYGIRVYNEGTVEGTASLITEYFTDGLKFDEDSEINAQYGWVKSADGKSATTDYLSRTSIKPYTIYNDIDHKEIFIELIVDAEETEEFNRLVAVAEITQESNYDADSEPGNITLPITSDFMQEESESSHANSYVKCVEDDMDFESLSISRKVTKPYSLVLNKIDGLDNQLLNGATFDLMDENKNVLKTGVTANGGIIDFGTIYAYGDQRTRYYIKETYTPEGYKNRYSYVIRLDVVPPKEDLVDAEDLKFEIDMHSIDVDTSKFETIEISTAEELRGIQDNLEKKYVLTQDIDLDGVTWEPLNVENVILDGQGHKIKNLTIEADLDTTKKIGLFATYSGIIENLTLENVNLKGTKELQMPGEVLLIDGNTANIDGLFEAENTETDIPSVGGIIAYSEDVVLKNCKVTGKVESEFKNVGGLVGHSKAGTITVFRGCTNEANVSVKKELDITYKIQIGYNHGPIYENRTETITEGRNAGGLIGVTLGPVYVSNSVNKGNVYAGKYNAGGFIGTAEENEYILNNVFGQYNEQLNIYVKNERINGKYKIKVKKVDETGENLLSGAKFTLYDINKNPILGYENKELTEGVLELPEKITSIGTDTFYLKETQAPSGYVQLTDTYIKIEITKTWDKENQKYETSVESKTLTPEEMENDVAKDKSTSTVATGTYINNTQNQNVVLKTNDVTIDKNSVNEGTITSEYINAGGFVGRAVCSVEVTDSINNGEVKADLGNAAGVVGQIEIEEGKNALLFTNNVQNNGKIQQIKMNENQYNNMIDEKMYFFSTAGIAGTVNSDVEIYHTINNGEISSEENHLGGIVATAYSDYLTIDNCTNNATISVGALNNSTYNSPYGAGGILGQGMRQHDMEESGWWSDNAVSTNEHSVFRVSNCTNTGDIEGYNGAGGIVSNTYVRSLYITNCSINECSIDMKGSNCSVGGIVGNTENERLVIEDCFVNKANITNGQYGTGGIVGYYGHTFEYKADAGLTIKGCNVNNSTLQDKSSYGIGGVVGNIQESFTKKEIGFNTLIEDCNVNNTNLIVVASSDYIGGIAGCEYAYDSANKHTFTINNCKVNGGEISFASYYSNGSIGGILSKACYTSVTITNCEVDGLKMSSNGGKSDNRNAAGILAYSEYATTTISHCNVKNVEYSGLGSKFGGIGGSLGRKSTNVTIDNCNVDNITIDNQTNTNNNCQGFSAGILAYTDTSNLNVTDCNITNSKIYSKQTNTGGALGSIDASNSTVKNVIVNNVEIEITDEYGAYGSASNYGGVIALFNHSNVTVENCDFINSSIKIPGCQVGGIIGTSRDIIIKDCEVNNSIVEEIAREGSGQREATAGIIAEANGDVEIENCKVINGSKIYGRGRVTGGIIGHVDRSASFKNCSVEDSEISVEQPNPAYTSIGGIVATGNVSKFENCMVKNTVISGTRENIGGLEAGFGNYSTAIDGCTIENLTINCKNNCSYADRPIAGAIAVGGNNTVENSTFKNIKINVEDNKCPCEVGGLFGQVDKLSLNSNNTISDIEINIPNVIYIGRVGGLVGTATGTATFEDLEISNININAGGYVGGLIGIAKDKQTISNSEFTNISVNGTKDGKIGGLIGVVPNIDISDVIITDLNMDNKVDAHITGGIVGTVDNTGKFENITIKASAGKTNTINANSTDENGYTGILLGFGKAISTDNITINNTNVDGTGCNAVGTIGMACDNSSLSQDSIINGITINNVNVEGSTNKMGGIVGYTNGIVKNCTANDIILRNTSTKQNENVATGGIVGMISKDNSTTSKIENCNVNRANITATNGYTGGAVGFSNNNITGIIVTDSVVNVTGEAANGAGGILGHGSNVSGQDVTITNSKLIDSIVTGNNQVGGISGGAVTKIQNCYVGKKENETIEEGQYAVTINGKDSVGAIIGDAGIISSESLLMLNMIGNNANYVSITRNNVTDNIPDIDKMIGTHNSFSEDYTGDTTRTEILSENTITDSIIVNNN